jgi:hypothetical protein
MGSAEIVGQVIICRVYERPYLMKGSPTSLMIRSYDISTLLSFLEQSEPFLSLLGFLLLSSLDISREERHACSACLTLCNDIYHSRRIMTRKCTAISQS